MSYERGNMPGPEEIEPSMTTQPFDLEREARHVFQCQDAEDDRRLIAFGRRCQEAMKEECAQAHANINPACVHERRNGDPGSGAIGAIIEYRDAIRALGGGGK